MRVAEPIEGCMDTNATNYNSTAEFDDPVNIQNQ